MKFYSDSTKGFYDPEIHGDNIPDDVVEITDEDYNDRINNQSTITPEQLAIAELKKTRDDALSNLVHDFGDGRIIQVRPLDAANLQFGIATGQSEWVMANDMPEQITTAELQTAFDSGISRGVAIWNDYMTAIKLL